MLKSAENVILSVSWSGDTVLWPMLKSAESVHQTVL